jgi:nicotinamide-nucleotide amidase
MQAEIVMIGTELLLGQIDDTNATYLGQVLADNGINLFQKTTVGDNRERIIGALNDALDRSDVILCSGGLGPTEDDITRECVAEVTGCPLEYEPEIFQHIEMMFARYKIKLTENNKKQAMVPKGGLIIHNPHGTAPGLLAECDRGIIFCMPGPPRELKPMLHEKVVPYIQDRYSIKDIIHYRVLHVAGDSESRIDDLIGDLMTDNENPKVGVLASPALVRIRISAKARSEAEANRIIDPVDEEIRKRLPGKVLGTNDDTIESVVNDLLAEKGWNIGVAETLSGGSISRRLSAIEASQFAGSRVYPLSQLDLSDPAKTALKLTDQFMLEYTPECVLAVVSDPESGVTSAAFKHPSGMEAWEFGRAGRGIEMQERITTVALEHVRRFLVSS